MSQPTSSISFKGLFDAALQEYENKTKIKLADDPLAKKLEACDSVDSITAILQEQAQVFGGFKDDGKIMKSLRSSVDVLYTLSNSTIIGQVVGLIVRTKSLIPVRFRFRASNYHSTAIPASECYIHRHRRLTFCMSPFPAPIRNFP